MTYDCVNDRLCMEFGVVCNYCPRNWPESNIICYKNMTAPDTDPENVQIQSRGLILFMFSTLYISEVTLTLKFFTQKM